jgi:aryl-alcohol dehydrogenase-like predicted oxidoreductase
LSGALAFVLSQPAVEKLVVGVESAPQLTEILTAMRPTAPPPEDLYSEDLDLIEPSRWKLK